MLNNIINNLFQIFVYLPVFSHDFTRYSLLLFLFHGLEVLFMNSYNNINNQMFVGPLSIKMQHLSLSLLCSQNIENTELSLPVPPCLVYYWTMLYRSVDCPSTRRDHNKCEAMNGHVSLAMSFSRENFVRRSKPIVRNFRIWKENCKELSQADNWFWSRGYEINYIQLCWLCLCWLCASFCDTKIL